MTRKEFLARGVSEPGQGPRLEVEVRKMSPTPGRCGLGTPSERAGSGHMDMGQFHFLARKNSNEPENIK